MANQPKRSSGRQPADSAVTEATPDTNTATTNSTPAETAPAAKSPQPPADGQQRPPKAPALNINDLKDMSIQKLTQVAKHTHAAAT